MPCRARAPTLRQTDRRVKDTRPGEGPPVKTDELLRRLALNDEQTVRSAIGAGAGSAAVGSVAPLDDKTRALVRLGALLSVGAATVSCRATVELARAAGATDGELVGVLLA